MENKIKKSVFSASIPEAILEEIRNIVYWTPGLTVNLFIEEAVNNHLKTIRENGINYPLRTGILKKGKRT